MQNKIRCKCKIFKYFCKICDKTVQKYDLPIDVRMPIFAKAVF